MFACVEHVVTGATKCVSTQIVKDIEDGMETWGGITTPICLSWSHFFRVCVLLVCFCVFSVLVHYSDFTWLPLIPYDFLQYRPL